MQDLAKKQQQQAAGAGGAAGGLDMQKMMEDAMKDPAAMQYLEKMGHDIGSAMEQLSKMTPEELESSMKEAFSALTDDSMLDALMGSPEDVLKNLEMTGIIPADELAKMKADPDYFKAKMKESFGQMQNMFQDPEMAGYMTQALNGMTELFQNGGALMSELEKLVGSDDLASAEKIEEARKALLEGDASNPMLQQLMGNDEMKAMLQDPQKFRDAVQEGRRALGADKKQKVGAGIGEL